MTINIKSSLVAAIAFSVAACFGVIWQLQLQQPLRRVQHLSSAIRQADQIVLLTHVNPGEQMTGLILYRSEPEVESLAKLLDSQTVEMHEFVRLPMGTTSGVQCYAVRGNSATAFTVTIGNLWTADKQAPADSTIYEFCYELILNGRNLAKAKQ